MRGSFRHTEWLSLIEVSGPFLVPKVLEEVFPQGLEGLDTSTRHRLRDAYEEWQEAVEVGRSDLDSIHEAWTRFVLEEFLEYDDDILFSKEAMPYTLSHHVAEHGETIVPDLVVVDATDQGRPSILMPIFIHPPHTRLERPLPGARWPASPLERGTLLCRAKGIRVGLVTNGERWTLVHVTSDGVSGHASWYARLWWQEPITLQAFRSLLGARRHFGPEDETLPSLLDRSLEYQDEVTDKLGGQVLRAVEVLVQALDRADLDRNGELLKDVSPKDLYEAALTVMMRLVFLLAAEERRLLPLGDPLYDSHYAVSTLRAQLRERADREGLEVLERRWEAWARLLATFRAVYGGIEHPRLRMPALGGSLFDPDRYPFLEGRPPGSHWRETPAHPLPIDDRTVLLLLESLQVLEERGGARLLSYRGLDVEQIGYVYEGLLEHTVARVEEPTLGLKGTKKAPYPVVGLSELEEAILDGEERLLDLLEERTGRSRSALRKDLGRTTDADTDARLLLACNNDQDLAERIRPFAHLLRNDVWGYPLVYLEGAMAVVHGTDRRESGSHYTPKAFTEAIVSETLEPQVYVGPSEGWSRERWKLRSPAELLDLKVCDPAMGSGAFLVQVCRYLAERLVESWKREEERGQTIGMDGLPHESGESVEPVPKDENERLVHARRLIAERCLYGVDLNPLAVELAKLSIWLVTLAKGRPLGFLDHNLRCGDSLLGILDLEQLIFLDLSPGRGSARPLFAHYIDRAVEESLEWRRMIRATPIRDVRDVREVEDMEAESRRAVEAPARVADALVGLALASHGDDRVARLAWKELAMEVGPYLSGDDEAEEKLARSILETLNTDLPAGKPPRRTFHWPLEFPEVFLRENSGFDAIVGNPPFMGGQRISGTLGGAYREYLVRWVAEANRGSADLVAYFYLRAFDLLREGGTFGLLAVNTIAEGDTRQVGLERLVGEKGAVIYAAYPNEPWPGKAAVVTSRVHIRKGEWRNAATLSGREVAFVSAFLSDQEEWTPKRLKANAGKAFQGCIILGDGFLISKEKASSLLEQDKRYKEVLFPYLNGEDLNEHPTQEASRWVINFWDWPEEKAKEYDELYRQIAIAVKPVRQRRDESGKYVLRKPLPQRWWQYGEKRPALFHAIGRGHRFFKHPRGDWPKVPIQYMVFTLHTKYWTISRRKDDLVPSHALGVFAFSDFEALAILQSTLHEIWAWKQSSRMGASTLRYSLTDAFQTFPFPALDEGGEKIRKLTADYYSLRAEIMCEEWIGLTQLYNRFHDLNEYDPRIQELRDLHRQIDEAVTKAYGWDDLDLEHGFHEVGYLPENDRVRFTISERARIEVLRRLAFLNKERYKEEVSQGLHGSTRRGGRKR